MNMRRLLASGQCALASLGLIMLVGYAPAMSAGISFRDMSQRESAGTSRAAAKSVWDGVYSAEQAKKGEVLYGNRCTSCHEENLGGANAPPLAGPYFFDRWGGQSVGDLLQLMQKTMPQDEPASMSPQEYVDIISYVLSVNGMPAGQTTLLPDSDKLRAIKFDQKASGNETPR